MPSIAKYPTYVCHVYIEGGPCGFEALVEANIDYDGEFIAYDLDNDELIKVYGWQCDISEM